MRWWQLMNVCWDDCSRMTYILSKILFIFITKNLKWCSVGYTWCPIKTKWLKKVIIKNLINLYFIFHKHNKNIIPNASSPLNVYINHIFSILYPKYLFKIKNGWSFFCLSLKISKIKFIYLYIKWFNLNTTPTQHINHQRFQLVIRASVKAIWFLWCH